MYSEPESRDQGEGYEVDEEGHVGNYLKGTFRFLQEKVLVSSSRFTHIYHIYHFNFEKKQR